MPLESKLLAAILAAPDDDAPRLVYADFLLERGDPRGEYIQLACAGRGSEAYDRQRALLAKLQKAWLAPIRPFIRSWDWSRGFVRRIEAIGAKFVEGAETIFSTTPLLDATLTGLKPPTLEKLAQTPLGSLRSLVLSQQRINPKTARVFESPHLRGLVNLDLGSNPLGDAGVATLAGARHLGALRSLDLSYCRVGIDGLEALSKAEFFPRLTRLRLDSLSGPEAVTLGPRAGELLSRAEELTFLTINQCGIGDEGMEAIAASPAMKNLEHLSLYGNDITARGALALARSPHLTNLRSVLGLDDREKTFGVEAARALNERFGAES